MVSLAIHSQNSMSLSLPYGEPERISPPFSISRYIANTLAPIHFGADFIPWQINRSIHLKYVTSEALNDASVASYLSKGDDVTVNVHIDHVVSWNLTDSKAGQALGAGGWFRPVDG
jgi:hypothetical protein